MNKYKIIDYTLLESGELYNPIVINDNNKKEWFPKNWFRDLTLKELRKEKLERLAKKIKK